jgi:sec-independent protein translocase protein TatC
MTSSQTRPPLDQLDLFSGAVMPLGDHLEELRRRLILALLGLLPFFVVALFISRPTMEFLLKPVQAALRDSGLPPYVQSTGPVEVFASYTQIAIILTILGGSWWILTQAWLFIRPGLYRTERRFVYILIPMSFALTITGVIFMYTLMLPVVLSFFITFGSSLGVPEYAQGIDALAAQTQSAALPSAPILQGDPPNPDPGQYWINLDRRELRVCLEQAQPGQAPLVGSVPLTSGSGILQLYRLKEYVGLILMLALGFAVGFQMPVVVLLLGWAGIVEPKDLAGARRYMVMGCLVVSGALTPADPLSMFILAVPLYLLYELGMILLKLMPARSLAPEPAEADA